jgi:chromosome partitioning protein
MSAMSAKNGKGGKVLTVAVSSQKGGSGKTTTAVNLAAALGERGKRVLVLDLDPQCSASTWLGLPAEGRGLLDALADGAPLAALAQNASAPGVDLVPA